MYHENWDATMGEELPCLRERGNPQDTFAVAVDRLSPQKNFRYLQHCYTMPEDR